MKTNQDHLTLRQIRFQAAEDAAAQWRFSEAEVTARALNLKFDLLMGRAVTLPSGELRTLDDIVLNGETGLSTLLDWCRPAAEASLRRELLAVYHQEIHDLERTEAWYAAQPPAVIS